MTFEIQIVHRHKVPLSITILYLKIKAHWRSEFDALIHFCEYNCFGQAHSACTVGTASVQAESTKLELTD